MRTETTKKTWLIHDPSTIYYLHPSEHAGNALTKYLLKSDNYEVWEKAIRNALGGRGKAIFLIPDGVPKPKDERELAAWESNNSIICSWIFNSVDESIQPSIVSHSVASVLWSDLKKRYSTSNGPRIYQLKTELNALRQKGQTVVAYYNQFITLWNQLHETGDPTSGCTYTAAATTRAKFEREKTIDFLLGLDDEQFGPLRSNLLGTEPIPDLDGVFHLVSQEKRHRTIIRSRDDKTDAMAFATCWDDRITRPPPPSEKLLCTHCGRTNHNVDACYELVGFPAHYTRLSTNRGPSAGRGGRGGSAGGRATNTGGRGGGRRGTPAVGNNTGVAHATTDEMSNLNLSVKWPASCHCLNHPMLISIMVRSEHGGNGGGGDGGSDYDDLPAPRYRAMVGMVGLAGDGGVAAMVRPGASMVDNRDSAQPKITPEQAVKLCDRNFGIGADGVIFTLPGTNGTDYTMRIFNSDGSEPEMCGNGIRCFTKFICKLENLHGKQSFIVHTRAGLIVPERHEDGKVRVDMGEPVLKASDVPTKLLANKDHSVVKGELEVDGTTWSVTCVSMGNPHCVTFGTGNKDLQVDEVNLAEIGPKFENHVMFPARTNTEFVQVLSPTHLKMCIWERGAVQPWLVELELVL
ncbi:unnamed protein product [Cuscuta campestris]|uniref:diaminopimelate epimerase n=1 Tax=Cuscuta campestris TaxID=132261 RepID=A0A484NBL9_9ASTE|nr:unnamed protein product [Cuscuta campestris]